MTYRYDNAARTAIRADDGRVIPVHLGNRDYREILERNAQIEDYVPPPPPVLSYRDRRALAYRDELGAETGDFVKTIGDVMDVLIAQLGTLPENSKTAEFKALESKVSAIKQRIPKP